MPGANDFQGGRSPRALTSIVLMKPSSPSDAPLPGAAVALDLGWTFDEPVLPSTCGWPHPEINAAARPMPSTQQPLGAVPSAKESVLFSWFLFHGAIRWSAKRSP